MAGVRDARTRRPRGLTRHSVIEPVKARVLWVGAGGLLLLGAALAPAAWPPLINVLIPAGAWCVLKGLT